MKAHILTTENISKEAIDETKEYTNADISIEDTDKLIPVKLNPYFNSMWGDFHWLRSQFQYGYDVRCYATSKAKLKKQGVTNHIGMYDMVDNDGVLDFYMGVPTKLDKRAKSNGFKTNFAWLFCHEYLHGREQGSGKPDRTHPMEEQGRLKELLKEYRVADLEERVSWLQYVLKTLLAQFQKPQTLHKRLPDPYNEMISQDYGVKNTRYPKTGIHIGIDYACPVGTPIYAPWDGEVIAIGNDEILGNYCFFKYEWEGKIRVERNLHMKYIPVVGKYKRGWMLGRSGDTGDVTGPHYHVDGWHDEIKIGSINSKNWDKLTYNPHI